LFRCQTGIELGDVAPKSSCFEESDLETQQALSATNIGDSSRATGNDHSRTSSHGWRRIARVMREDVVLKHMLLPSHLLSSIVSQDLTYMPRSRLVRCRRHVPFHSKSRQTRYTYAENANLHNTLAAHVSPRYISIGMAQQPTFHVVVTSLAILSGKPLNAIQMILRPVSQDKRPTPSKA
jgi:hypothetical protein